MMRANFYFFPLKTPNFALSRFSPPRALIPIYCSAFFHFFYFIISTLHCAVRKDSPTRFLLIPFMSRILYYLVSNSLYLCLLLLLEKSPLRVSLYTNIWRRTLQYAPIEFFATTALFLMQMQIMWVSVLATFNIRVYTQIWILIYSAAGKFHFNTHRLLIKDFYELMYPQN